MPITFNQLKENIKGRVFPSSAKVDDSYDEKHPKKMAHLDTVDEFPDLTDDEGNYSTNVKSRSNTAINKGETTGDKKMPKVTVREDIADLQYVYIDETYALLEEVEDLLENLEMMNETAAFQEAAKNLRHVRDCLLAATPRDAGEAISVHEEFKAGELCFKDGSKVMVTPKDAYYLNQMFSSTAARAAMEKTLKKNSKEYTSILQFAKSLHLGEQLEEEAENGDE